MQNSADDSLTTRIRSLLRRLGPELSENPVDAVSPCSDLQSAQRVDRIDARHVVFDQRVRETVDDVARTNAVHPVIVRGKVAARPAELADIQFPYSFYYVAAKPVRVRERSPAYG